CALERWRGVARTSVSLWFTLMPPALTCVLTVRLGAGRGTRTSVSLWLLNTPPALTCVLTFRAGAGWGTRTSVSLWLFALRSTLPRVLPCIHFPPACLVVGARSVRCLPPHLLSPCGGGQRRGEGTPHTHPGLPHWRGRAPGPWRCLVLLQVPCQPGPLRRGRRPGATWRGATGRGASREAGARPRPRRGPARRPGGPAAPPPGPLSRRGPGLCPQAQ